MNVNRLIRQVNRHLGNQRLPISSLSVAQATSGGGPLSTFHPITDRDFLRVDWSKAPGAQQLQKVDRIINNLDLDTIANPGKRLSVDEVAAGLQALPDKTWRQLVSRYMAATLVDDEVLAEQLGIDIEETTQIGAT